MTREPCSRPDRLYHYTDAQGLLGVLENKTLWATHARYLNDSRELHHGVAVLETLLERYKKNDAGLAAPIAHAIGQIGAPLSHMCIELQEYTRAFVVSFSEERDLLSQWRAYGADGAGFAIGFSRKHLEALPVTAPADATSDSHSEYSGWSIGLQPCVYDEVLQKNAMHAALMALLEAAGADQADAMSAADDEPIMQITDSSELAYEFLRGSSTSLCSLKHHSFKEEREWRLLVLPRPQGRIIDPEPTPGIKFRARNGALLPYWEVSLRPDLAAGLGIEEIVVGPRATSHQRDLAYASVNELLLMHRLRVAVTESDIPYRPL